MPLEHLNSPGPSILSTQLHTHCLSPNSIDFCSWLGLATPKTRGVEFVLVRALATFCHLSLVLLSLTRIHSVLLITNYW